RLGRAGLLAGGDDLVTAQRPVLLVGGDMCGLPSLRAIAALLHHAARAHSDIRVLYRLLGFGKLAVVVPVEAAHLVGAIARAGACADAAIVNHLIDTLRRMRRGMNRAAHLARRLLAVHARHRLEQALRILNIAGVVAIDTEPGHFASARDLIFADHKYIV